MTKQKFILCIRLSIFFILLCIAVFSQAGSWQFNVSKGGFNNVHIYTPDTQSTIGSGRALLIVLHGCVQPIDNFKTANLEVAAETYGMVIAVPDAMNKAGFSCWSYWQGAKSRNSGDYRNLINLAIIMTSEPEYDIDADQVYISGMSSGASFANTTACLAPDIFAGMGISAGPSIGTSASGALNAFEVAPVRVRCLAYAAGYSDFLNSQIASLAHGDADTTVDLRYNRQNANGMAEVYGVSELNGPNTISEGMNRNAQETRWQDGRVTMLWFNSIEHAWSGGESATGGFISGASINYASYLGNFFMENNKRVSRNLGPFISELNAQESGSSLLISGRASDAEGSVENIAIALEGVATGVSQAISTDDGASGLFSVISDELPDDLYIIEVYAADNEGAIGDTVSILQRVGSEPPPAPPELSTISASINGRCAIISGTVIDVNQNLSSVVVNFASGTINATITGMQYMAEKCELPGGNNIADVLATDTTHLESTDNISFEIDVGETSDYNLHISRGHITWGVGYADCYLEYGASQFTMFEKPFSSNCRWEDEDGSCVGPEVNCSSAPNPTPTINPSPMPAPSPACEEVMAQNYFHKLAARAYSDDNIVFPDYFAIGSNDAMTGSTWGISTLHSLDENNWFIGNCP